MVAHAICGSPLWGVRVQDQRSRTEAITESIETSVAEARFDERRRAVLAVLGFDPDEPSVTLGHEPRNGVSALFLRLLELPDAVVMEVLSVVMAETLASGTCLIETIGLHLGVKMADYWVADDAFFGLMRDREVMTEVLREVGGDTVAQAHATEKGKTIKGVINDYLTGGNGRTKVENWVPRWMAFPPSGYPFTAIWADCRILVQQAQAISFAVVVVQADIERANRSSPDIFAMLPGTRAHPRPRQWLWLAADGFASCA